MMRRANIGIKGNVQMAGFRTFIENIADSLNVTGFAENVEDGSVKVVCEGEEGGINELIDSIKENTPSFASIKEVNTAYEEYKGEFTGFVRRGADVPGEESEMLTVMKSFDKKAEKMVGILGSVDERLGNIEGKQDQTLGKQDQMLEKQDQTLGKQDQMLGKQDQMLEKQDQTLEKQDQMLEKQDETISIIKTGVDEMQAFREENKTILQDFHQDTIQRFDSLDVKYGRIAKNIERFLEELKEERKEYRDSIEKLVAAIIESRKK